MITLIALYFTWGQINFLNAQILNQTSATPSETIEQPQKLILNPIKNFVNSFVPELLSSPINKKLDKVIEKFDEAAKSESFFVTPLGLPCDPNKTKICNPRSTSTTTEAPSLKNQNLRSKRNSKPISNISLKSTTLNANDTALMPYSENEFKAIFASTKLLEKVKELDESLKLDKRMSDVPDFDAALSITDIANRQNSNLSKEFDSVIKNIYDIDNSSLHMKLPSRYITNLDSPFELSRPSESFFTRQLREEPDEYGSSYQIHVNGVNDKISDYEYEEDQLESENMFYIVPTKSKLKKNYIHKEDQKVYDSGYINQNRPPGKIPEYTDQNTYISVIKPKNDTFFRNKELINNIPINIFLLQNGKEPSTDYLHNKGINYTVPLSHTLDYKDDVSDDYTDIKEKLSKKIFFLPSSKIPDNHYEEQFNEIHSTQRLASVSNNDASSLELASQESPAKDPASSELAPAANKQKPDPPIIKTTCQCDDLNCNLELCDRPQKDSGKNSEERTYNLSPLFAGRLMTAPNKEPLIMLYNIKSIDQKVIQNLKPQAIAELKSLIEIAKNV